MWRALKIFVEEELADDVAGPVHDNNQHAEVVSGPVITLGVQSETSCFTITLLERLTKIVMAKFGEPLPSPLYVTRYTPHNTTLLHLL